MTQDDRTPDELLDAIGPAFGKLRRGVLQEVEDPISTKDSTRALLLGMVLGCPQGTGREPHDPGQEMTVGGIAAGMCVDPSVASRMVADSIKAGYLRRVPSQLDGRRAVLELSEQGLEFMRTFRRRQRATYEYITAEWPEQDRLEFARLMLRYVDAIDDLKNRRPPADA